MNDLQWVAAAGLIAIMVIASLRPINIGLLGFAFAFLVGALAAGMPVREVLSKFPGDLFVTIIGITCLFGIARQNGTIDWLVDWAAKLLGGRRLLMPLLVFILAAVLTATGALGPAAVAILAPIALRYAKHYRLPPLLMGLATINGAQAGAFSPLSVYGNIASKVMAGVGMAQSPVYLALASLAFNAMLFLPIYAVLLRRPLPGAAADPAGHQGPLPRLTRDQSATLGGLMAVAAGALGLRLDIGLLAIIVTVLLAIGNQKIADASLKGVDWSTALLIAGIATYVGVMEQLGVTNAIGHQAASLANPLVATLVICCVAGLVSAFASSTALLAIVIPLAAPIVAQGNLSAISIVSAIAVSTTIVDTSPFSTNGALVVANAESDEKASVLRSLALYTMAVVLAGPPLAWLVFAILVPA